MIGLSIATVVVATIVAISLAATRATPAAPKASDWQSKWAVQSGFDISIDSQGFQFPTSIAFIPEPGDSPESPLYFVTELQGRVKVVSNDRTVLTFAEDFFVLRPKKGESRVIDQEIGMAGICLAPEHGYVFVTFSYHDSHNILRNNIVRFQSTPRTFSITPTSQVDFTEVLASYESAPSHQIGACQVEGGLLYVSVADAHQTEESQRMDSVLGKILRMTLDGLPVPHNPFYRDDDITNAQNYIWASGLRNPFGLKIVGDQVFVADNGPNVDRFLQVKEGGNYLWDGTDTSIGTNADVVFSPGRGVAQLDRYPPSTNLFPDRFKDNFFLTMTGNPQARREGFPAIWSIPYDFSQDKLSAVTRTLLRYRGQRNQIVSGLSFGPDGLYFAPLFPNNNGSSQVLKIRYAPEAEYPFTLEEELNPVVLLNTHGCLACHSLIDGQGGVTGPTLDRNALVPRLERRLNSEAYARTLEELDQLELEPISSFREARQAIVQAQGLEKIRLWLYNQLLEPKFDDLDSAMPRPGFSNTQAEAVAHYLSGIPGETVGAGEDHSILSRITDVADNVVRPVENRLPYPTRDNAKKYLAAVFGIGFFMGAVILALSLWLLACRTRKRRGRASK